MKERRGWEKEEGEDRNGKRREGKDLIKGELEENSLRDVFPSTSLSTNVRGLDRHLLRREGELGDDDPTVCLGHTHKVLRQQCELLELLKGVWLGDEGLELAVPVEGRLKDVS